jgi:hypothetical protein
MHWIMGESCLNASRKSGHAIAKHVGVDDKTIAGLRAEIAPTVEIQQSTKRKGADGGRRQALAGGLSPA